MADFLSPGTKITQVRKGPVVPSDIATAISGFLVYTEKGPVGKPVKVTSPDDAAEVFGGRITSPGNGRLTDAMIDYSNEGGVAAWIVRFIGAGSAVAEATLTTIGGETAGSISSDDDAFPVALENGDTFTASVDGGGATTKTVVANKAHKLGVGATFATVAPGTTMTLTIAGFSGTQTITFAGASNSLATYLQEINDQLVAAKAMANGGQIDLVTDLAGSSSAGNILTLGTGLGAALGLTTGAFTLAGGSNVANVQEVTEQELGLILNFTGSTATPDDDANSLTISSNTTGTSSSFQFTAGTGVSKIAGFDLALHSGTLTAPDDAVLLTAAVGPDDSPGSYANDLSYTVAQQDTKVAVTTTQAAGSTTTLTLSTTGRLRIGDTISITKLTDTQRGVIKLINGTLVTFVSAITVPGGGYDGTQDVILETWSLTIYAADGSIIFPSPFRNLRMSSLAGSNYFVNAINSAARTPVHAEDLSPTAADPRPTVVTTPAYLSGGLDGAAPTATEVLESIDAFDAADDVSFISVPGCNTDFTGANGVAILTELQAYLENRQDTMGVISTPQGTPATGSGGARDYVQNTANLASSYLMMYWPYFKRLDFVTNTLALFPPEPFIQGIVARVHKLVNYGRAPAGQIANVRTIQDLEFKILENSAEYDDMYPAGVNATLKFPGQGFLVWGSKTLDPTGEFGQINVQVVFNVNKRQVRRVTRFVNFENNTPTTRASVVRVLTSLFREQRKAGILQGTKDEEAFFIVCDDTNNTPAVIASGKLKVRIGLAVNRPSEFVDITMEIDTRAIDAALAASGT